MSDPKPAINGKNGLFLKVIIPTLIAGLVAAGTGLVVLYGDVRELKKTGASDQRINDMKDELKAIRESIATLSEYPHGIGADRDKRTEWKAQIDQWRPQVDQRLDALDRRR